MIQIVDEFTLQVRCVEWFRKTYPQYRLLIHHSPNGGRRSASEGAKFKILGTRAGWPDLQLAIARGGYFGLFVELKHGRGRVSPDQQKMLNMLAAQGYLCVVVRDLESFIKTVKKYIET